MYWRLNAGLSHFWPATHLGIVHYLDIYNSRSYTAMSTTHYGKTLGEIMDETIAKVFGITTENDFYARFHCEQFTLHGDPALHMYNFAKPDYVIEAPMVKVSPNFISVNATGV
ncbi:MAG: C25 family cysteine peptidase [Bacteroidota bacterium]